ncbi:MAG: PQQ-binding-like beta-propeller repeat protein [Fuerstiella sp.]|nr:PQQ-binding-like beta-propeller repeat protein [Fuerstiella sp.]
MRIGLLTGFLLLAGEDIALADWPQFRGPDGQGHATESNVPLRWSETENVQWKTLVPGEGYSSPVIKGNQIWMTAATEDGKSLHAVCVDLVSGEVIHNTEVLTPASAGSKHGLNGYASPTPVVDDQYVFTHFGGHGTVCLDRDGQIVWKNTELPFSAVQGSASSPVLHDGLLILTCDGNDTQFLAALDRNTGEVQWKEYRTHYEGMGKTKDFFKMAYSTPLIGRVNGVDQLVSTAADHVAAYDVKTGKEIWWMPYIGCSQVARPSFGHGLFYVVGTLQLDEHCIYAIRPGQGRTGSDRVVWQRSQGVGHVPSPLLVGSELYFVNDDGIATCVDALTGEEHWRERLGGNFRASPVEVQGRIYFSSEQGKTTVLAAATDYQVLATNELDAELLASPAVSGNAIVLRSSTHLYRIE